jgi:hypothetical protein
LTQVYTKGFNMPFIPDSQSQPQRTGFVPDKKSLEGFGQNLGRSAGNYVTGTVKGVANILNPDFEKNTLGQLLLLGSSVVEALLPGEQGNEDRARQLAEYFKQRYGGIDNIYNTFYNDPVGLIDDASLLLTGGGSAIKGAGVLGKVDDVARIGSNIQKAGNLLEPANLAFKVGQAGVSGMGKITNNLTNGIKPKVGEMMIGASDELLNRSFRASPSQATNFEKLTGNTIPQYRRQNKLFGSADELVDTVGQKIKDSPYNKMVRTGEIVDPTPYVDSLRKQAQSLEFSGSKENLLIAKDLYSRADILEESALRYMDMNNTSGVPINMLTDVKSSSFGKVSNNTMIDPTMASGAKESGKIGASYLEELAPGSRHAGKTMQADILLKEIAEKQKNLGKGTQLINAFKPVGYGSGMGGIVGGVQGALVGGLTAATINNPKVLSKLSEAFYKTGTRLKEGGKVAKPTKVARTSSFGGKIYQGSRVSRASERISSGLEKQSQEAERQKKRRGQSNQITKAILSKKNRDPFSKL